VSVVRKTYDFFLSYSRNDESFVKALNGDLIERGVVTFLDQFDLNPGELYEDKIFSEIANSKAYGLVVTRNSAKSTWVEREYRYARTLFDRGDIQIIPLHFEQVVTTDFLASHNALQFSHTGNYQQNLTRLLFPGITKRDITAILVNEYYGPIWDRLRDALNSRYGIKVSAPGDIDRGGHLIEHQYLALDTFTSWGRQESAKLRQSRLIVFIDIFCGWPYNKDARRNSVRQCLEFVFKVRQRTRGTPNEIVFVLVHHSTALAAFAGEITDTFGTEGMSRLAHYFHIANDTPSADVSQFDPVWARVLRELMNAER